MLQRNDYILKNLKDQGADTKEKIVRAAAKIIKEEIRAMDFTKDHYPCVSDITTNDENEKWVPESLQLLMEFIVPTTLKQISLSQCIVQAVRPRSVIAPIPFGVGLNIDKSTGCKQMITHFSRLGFSISADEVYRFKQSAIEAIDKGDNQEGTKDGFRQWVADNVDHNIATLTGKGTFHGMGIVCVDSLPLGGFSRIERLKSRPPAGSLTKCRGVDISPHQQVSRSGLAKFTFEAISKTTSHLTTSTILSSEMATYDLLWHYAWFLSSSENPRSNWSGFLQCCTSAVTSEKSASTITFLPIIDLSPSDETCIYSTLLFVISQARKLNVRTPSITFDQPLWIKAFDIVHAENLPIICRLGGFHTLMSFLGSVGAIMKGSGLEDLFIEVYAGNSVSHMMSGKSIARSIRGHLLVESSLMSLLLSMVKEKTDTNFEEFGQFYDRALGGTLDQQMLQDFAESPVCQKVLENLDSLKADLRNSSRTSELWHLYMYYVHLMKAFIFAERTSDWQMHRDVLSQMLNLFAATGHINYARSARLCVQQMRKLPQTHPWLHSQFLNGFHTVHRTSKNWTGIWTDLAIEQTLMRSIKSSGGLTGSRGMTESVRHTWVLSLGEVAMVHDAMLTLTGAATKTSEQHQDMGKSRTKQDFHDCLRFLDWLAVRNPFLVSDSNLHSLSTGLVSTQGKMTSTARRQMKWEE